MMVLLADPNTSHLALEETLPGALGDVVRVGTKMSRGVEVEADPISNRVDKVTSHGLLIERSKKVYRWFRVLVCRCLVQTGRCHGVIGVQTVAKNVLLKIPWV